MTHAGGQDEKLSKKAALEIKEVQEANRSVTSEISESRTRLAEVARPVVRDPFEEMRLRNDLEQILRSSLTNPVEDLIANQTEALLKLSDPLKQIRKQQESLKQLFKTSSPKKMLLEMNESSRQGDSVLEAEDIDKIMEAEDDAES